MAFSAYVMHKICPVTIKKHQVRLVMHFKAYKWTLDILSVSDAWNVSGEYRNTQASFRMKLIVYMSGHCRVDRHFELFTQLTWRFQERCFWAYKQII